MADLTQILREVKRNWGIETVAAIINSLNDRTSTFKGNLEKSIASEQEEGLDGDITFKMIDYGHFLDLGVNGARSAFTSPYQFKGVSENKPEKIRAMGGALKEWADSKGLNAWAVAWSIQRKGLKPRRFFDSVIELRLNEVLPADLEKAYLDYLEGLINTK